MASSVFNRFPLSGILLFWIAGLGIGEKYAGISTQAVLITGFLLFAMLAVLHRLSFSRYGPVVFFRLTAYLLALTTGYFYGKADNPYVAYRYVREYLPKNPVYVRFGVRQELNPTSYYRRYLGKALQTDKQKTGFDILIRIPLSDSIRLEPGKSYVYYPSSGEWAPFPPPPFPENFNYREYALKKHLFFRLKIRDEKRLKPVKNARWFTYFFYKLRQKIRRYWQQNGMKDQRFAVASAVLLGERQWLSPDTKKQFADAGIIHILAISGLHVGILFMLLRFILSPLRRRKWLYILLITGFLWLYAALTGFPASVVRAVLMFSLLQTAMEMQRKIDGFYALLLTAFFMLLVRPGWIFDVGFQLSFAAVWSIMTFYPLLKNLYLPKIKVLRYLLELLYVSVAAQIGVAPLIFYYFHRFSFVFLAGNILVLPLLTLILISGIAGIISAVAGWPVAVFVKITDGLLRILLLIVSKLSALHGLIWHHITWTPLLFIGILPFVAALYYFMKKPGLRGLIVLAYALLLFLAADLADLYRESRKKENILTFHRGYFVFLEKNGQDLHIHAEKGFDRFDRFEQAYRNKTRIASVDSSYIESFFRWKNKSFLIIDGSYRPEVLPVRPDYCLIKGKPKINLDIVLNKLRPGTVILAGNHPVYLRRKWEKTLKQRGIPYVNLTYDGYRKIP